MGHPQNSIKRLSSPLDGEIVKLLATTFFGFLVTWTQEIERLSDKSGINFEELMLFTKLKTKDFEIANKFPGIIGGHCVMPNIKIFKNAYPFDLWDYLIKSNQKKKERENLLK